jgi:hypothetical protein
MTSAQTPAEGVMLVRDYGAAKTYKIACQCQSDDHIHNLWIEAEESEVTVTIYAQLKSKGINRWHRIWQLLSTGYIDCEESIIMTQQQALNYAEALKSAAKDVEEFKKSLKHRKQHGST